MCHNRGSISDRLHVTWAMTSLDCLASREILHGNAIGNTKDVSPFAVSRIPDDVHAFRMTFTRSGWRSGVPDDVHAFRMTFTRSGWRSRVPDDVHAFRMTFTRSGRRSRVPDDVHAFRMTFTLGFICYHVVVDGRRFESLSQQNRFFWRVLPC